MTTHSETHLYTFLTSRARGGASASGSSLSGAPRSCWGFSNRVLQTTLSVTWSLVIFTLSETHAWPGVRAAGGRAVRSVRADAAQLLTSAVTCPAPGSLTRHFSIQTELLQRKVTLLGSFRKIILFSGLSLQLVKIGTSWIIDCWLSSVQLLFLQIRKIKCN